MLFIESNVAMERDKALIEAVRVSVPIRQSLL